MSLQLLPKEQVKILEETTTPIVNISHDKSTVLMEELKLTEWYRKVGISAGKAKEKWNYLIKAIGKPSYYVNHKYKNALWGFSWKGYAILLYVNKEGTSLQVEKRFDAALVSSLFNYIKSEILRGK